MFSLFDWLFRFFHKAPPRPARITSAHLNTFRSKRTNRIMSTVTLTWIDPTFRTDAPPTPLSPSEIADVRIFDSAAPDPTVPIGTVMGPATTFTTGILSVGLHNFTVVVDDTTGHSSAPSNTFSITVPATLAPPAPATNLTGVLNP